MNIVSDAGSIWRVVVTAIDGDVGSPATGGLEHQGNEVGLRVMSLTKLPLWISPCRIEIAQANRLQPIGAVVVRQRLLNH